MEKSLDFIQIILRAAMVTCLICIMLALFRLMEIHSSLYINLIDLTKISQEIDENIYDLKIYNSHFK